jgi:hypothetical protein
MKVPHEGQVFDQDGLVAIAKIVQGDDLVATANR